MKKSPSSSSKVIVLGVYVWIFRAWAPDFAAASTILSARSKEWLWLPDISATIHGRSEIAIAIPPMVVFMMQIPKNSEYCHAEFPGGVMLHPMAVARQWHRLGYLELCPLPVTLGP